jgi:beta-phosphoglucomutase-like phosphatase (HAD superfamily)
VKRLISDALASGQLVAVASTSAAESVRAVLEHVTGPKLAAQVRVFAGDIVPKKKPAPDIYLHAMRELKVTPTQTVIVEDSEIGCQAALAAAIAPIITVSSYTSSDNFTGAAIVLSDLGEPDSPASVLTNSSNVPFTGLVDLATLQAVLARR